MKKANNIRFKALIISVLAFALILTGCSSDQSGLTVDEPEITIDYLKGEYADQLMRDGAEYVFGTIDFEIAAGGEETDGDKIVIAAKEYVVDPNYPDGYYIADRNKSYIAYMPAEARTTYMVEGSSSAVMMSPYDFLTAVRNDYVAHESDLLAFKESKLYHIYLMGDQILLIMAWDK